MAVLMSKICCNITLDSLQCFSNGLMHTASIFIANSQTLQFYCSTTLFIMHFLCDFVLQLVETAICFTICMIQCVFSILLYSFNHIWDVLASIYMPVPSEDKWKSIADEFYERWNFPNCIGAIDGKHVMIQCPIFTGWALAGWPEMSYEKHLLFG